MGTAFGKRMALVPVTQPFSPFVVHLYGGTSDQNRFGRHEVNRRLQEYALGNYEKLSEQQEIV